MARSASACSAASAAIVSPGGRPARRLNTNRRRDSAANGPTVARTIPSPSNPVVGERPASTATGGPSPSAA